MADSDIPIEQIILSRYKYEVYHIFYLFDGAKIPRFMQVVGFTFL